MRQRGHYILTKGSIWQKDIIFINIDVPNIGAAKYIKQTMKEIILSLYTNVIAVSMLSTRNVMWDTYEIMHF